MYLKFYSNLILEQVSCGGHDANSGSHCNVEFGDWCNGECHVCDGVCVLITESKCTIQNTIVAQTDTNHGSSPQVSTGTYFLVEKNLA